ncbi:MAG: hypothetical protein RL748_2073 [Pseudomonadota bacterium]|jgi:antitoxin CcdA
MELTYDIAAPKKSANLSNNSGLLIQAGYPDANFTGTLEQASAEVVRQCQHELWLAENQKAIEAYADFVEENGVFSDGLRGF